jgi:ubiquinone/menaquinone biosynthesis C-methylase UbiE
MHHDALTPFPFCRDSFDFSIASYVAHGLTPEEREKMLREMKRVSKHYVVLHEYGKRRKITTDIIERLEGGNYFGFIKNIESELNGLFGEVKIIEVGKNGLWYVCRV